LLACLLTYLLTYLLTIRAECLLLLLFTDDAVRTTGKTLLRRRQTTSGHVTPPLVIVAIVISSAAVVGAVVLTLVVRCRRQHNLHHRSHRLATADKPTSAPPSRHVTAPFIVTSSRGAVTSHPGGRHAGYDRVAPLIPHVRYDPGIRPS